MLKVFPEAYYLIRSPGNIRLVRSIHSAALKYLVLSHEYIRDNVPHIIHHFPGQVFICRGTGRIQLFQKSCHRTLPLGLKALINALLQLCGVLLRKVRRIDHAVVDQRIVYIVDGYDNILGT